MWPLLCVSAKCETCSELEKSCSGLGTNKQKLLSSAYTLIEVGNKLILYPHHILKKWEFKWLLWHQSLRRPPSSNATGDQNLMEPVLVLGSDGVWQWSYGAGQCHHPFLVNVAWQLPPAHWGALPCADIINSPGFCVGVGYNDATDLTLSGQH